MIQRDDMAEIMEEIALLLELQGENPFKIRAYRTAAEAIRTHPGDIVELAANEDLTDLEALKGIGSAIALKLHELATTGKLEFHAKLRGEFPETIFDLFDIQGLGPKKVKALYEKLGIDSVEKLKAACESGEVAGLSGFGKKTAEKVLDAIAFRESNADRFRLGEVAPVAEQILEQIKSHPDVTRAEIAGSYRRGKETVHDLDFIAASKKPVAVMDFFVELPEVSAVINHGKTKSSVHLDNGLQCDLRVVTNDEYPCALVYFTGSKEHNVALRSRALKRGLTLNEYRLGPVEDGDAEAPEINEERDVYSALGLDYIEPEIRENNGEVEAAEEGTLPDLLQTGQLCGTFHNHTTASDGKSTLEEMADAARELGLQYLGIADHSKASFQANGLDEKRLRAQIAEIAKLNKTFKGEFRLFSGTECDILKDGTLDFDDEILSEVDYVVASVHGSFTLSEAAQTKRIIRAMENPFVTMMGHLTGRLLLSREPYAVDIPAVIDAAAATGTIIELNASPWRLDMDWRWWRLAVEKGVRCAINPDAHHIDGLQYLFFGAKVARKGWLTRKDVVNCLPLGEIEEVLKAKRGAA